MMDKEIIRALGELTRRVRHLETLECNCPESAPGGGGGPFPVFTGEIVGPESYNSGGFILDLTELFEFINYAGLEVYIAGNLPPGRHEVVLNSPADGFVTFRVMRTRYSLIVSIDNVSGEPVGVTIQSASGATVGSESAHKHTQTTFATPLPGVMGAAAVGAITTAGTPHAHTDDNLYEHQHGFTIEEADAISVEIDSGTDLSGTTWIFFSTGEPLDQGE